MIIHVEYGERNSIVEFTEDERSQLRDYALQKDRLHGFDVSDVRKYNNDDYLYVVYLVQKVIEAYYRMNYIPISRQWRDGYREVPYIHVELFDGCAMTMIDGERVPNDKGLVVQVYGPNMNDCYILRMDRNYLLRYIQFLQQIFDRNQEIFTDLSRQVTFCDGHTGFATEGMAVAEKFSKNDILLQALRLKNQGAKEPGEAMMNYALSLTDDEKVPMPNIVFINDHFDGLAFYDEKRKGLTIPLKKQIYNTSGFAKYFYARNDLISQLFEESILAVIAHEFSHVANGHCLLGKNKPNYANQKKIRICAEQNADDSAIRLQMSEPLFHGKSGNPHDYELEYTAHELVELWSIRGFSMYLSLSWMYRGEDREWNDRTLEGYLKDTKIKHPLYQFRTFNSINRIINHLSGVLAFEESKLFKTADGNPVDEKLIKNAVDKTMDLINSFESCFEICYGEEERSLDELLDQSWKIERTTVPTDSHKVPYCMPIINQSALEEIESILGTWPELKQMLEESGSYSMLYNTI